MRSDYIIIAIGYVALILNYMMLRQKAGGKDLYISCFILLAGASFYLMLAIDVPMRSYVDLMGYLLAPLYKPVASWVMEGR